MLEWDIMISHGAQRKENYTDSAVGKNRRLLLLAEMNQFVFEKFGFLDLS